MKKIKKTLSQNGRSLGRFDLQMLHIWSNSVSHSTVTFGNYLMANYFVIYVVVCVRANCSFILTKGTRIVEWWYIRNNVSEPYFWATGYFYTYHVKMWILCPYNIIACAVSQGFLQSLLWDLLYLLVDEQYSVDKPVWKFRICNWRKRRRNTYSFLLETQVKFQTKFCKLLHTVVIYFNHENLATQKLTLTAPSQLNWRNGVSYLCAVFLFSYKLDNPAWRQVRW